MKTKSFLCGFVAVFSLLGFLCACGDSDDTVADDFSVSAVPQYAGVYLAKPTLGSAAGLKWYETKGVEIGSNGVVWVYDFVVNEKKSIHSLTAPKALTDFKGGEGVWRASVNTDKIFFGAVANNRIYLCKASYGDTGEYLVPTQNGLTYNGVEYYRPSYFNSYVSDWTGSVSPQTDAQDENVTVRMSVTTTKRTSFIVVYSVTVTATGSGFTVATIGVKGNGVLEYKYTSANSYTFTVQRVPTGTCQVRGYVRTTSGKTYYSDYYTM